MTPEAWVSDETLAQSRQRYASMFTHHPHATYSLDPRGYYTEANPRALAMTGLSLAEMRRSHFAQVIHPDDLHLVQAGFERAMTGVGQVVEARVLRADGTIIDFRTTMIPVVVDGRTIGVHGVTEDVTEAKQVLRELEEANAAKTLFLATLSHELRTPLAALVGATDLLQGTDLGCEQQHFADLVDRSGQRVLQLVQDMLEFSCLEARRTALQPRPLEVRSVVAEVAEWAAPLAAGRGLATSFVIDDGVPVVAVGDGQRIAQVLANFVRNAITFTERGSVDVRVSARPAEPGAEVWVDFAVTDTGIGIAQDRICSLLEPFAQLDPCATRERRGTGLGLAICRDLVDLMHGRIQVTSEPGVGSTFDFGVPLGRP